MYWLLYGLYRLDYPGLVAIHAMLAFALMLSFPTYRCLVNGVAR